LLLFFRTERLERETIEKIRAREGHLGKAVSFDRYMTFDEVFIFNIILMFD